MAIHSPLYIQKADVADPDIEYPAREFRQVLRALLAEGILDGGVVTQRAAGANFTVDVSAFSAVIDGDDETNQGAYLVWSDAVENVTVSAAPGANSRIDLVVLEVNDEQAGGAAAVPLGRVRVIAGTPAGSPVAPAVPDSAIALATIGPITTVTTAIVNALIADERDLARLRHEVVTAGAIAAGAVTGAKMQYSSGGTLAVGSIEYYRFGDMVHVWTVSAGATQSATLPVGFRPATNLGAPSWSSFDGAGSVQITTGGVINSIFGQRFNLSFVAA